MRTTAEIVSYLTRYFQEKSGMIKQDLLASKTSALIQEMGVFLEERLAEETPHKSIWGEFIQNPEENAASLTGILEALFEAQPAVRNRVDGFMQAVTALESKNKNQPTTQEEVLDSLASEAGRVMTGNQPESEIQADSRNEKMPPAYLYGNERAGYEQYQDLPEANEFMIGKNAQVIFTPNEKMRFPSMFLRLGQLVENSKQLSLSEKRSLQSNLDEIMRQLTEKEPFEEAKIAVAFEAIWETAPSYANALIESLQNHIDELPIKTRDFVIQLHTPLH